MCCQLRWECFVIRVSKSLSWFSPRYHSIFCAHLGLQTCTQSPTGDGGVLTVQEREIRKELWNGSVHTWQVCSGVFGVSYSGIPNPQGENGRTPPPVQPIPAVKLSKPHSEKTRGFCGDLATCGKLNCTRSHINGKDWLVTDRTLWGLFDRMKCKTSDCSGALKCVDVTGSWCSNGVMRFRCVMGRR